jgi:hypothetical protein
MSRSFKRAKALEYQGRYWLWEGEAVKVSMKLLYKFMCEHPAYGSNKKLCKNPTNSLDRLQTRHLRHVSSKVDIYDDDEHLDIQDIARTTNRKKAQSCYWFC